MRWPWDRRDKAAELARIRAESRQSLARATEDLQVQRENLARERATVNARYDKIIGDNSLAEALRRAFGGIA